jgi:hypothetical protein
MTIAYTTDRAVPGASVGGARHAGFGWVVRGKGNTQPPQKTALKQTIPTQGVAPQHSLEPACVCVL